MKQTSGIERFETLLRSAPQGPPPLLEAWNPPYCGDIGLAIHSDGTWSYRGSPIRRMALVKLFARVLRREANGRYYLVTPAEKIDVAVEDAPFLAVEMETFGEGADQRIIFRTNVDDIVACGPEHPLRFVTEAPSGGLKPYLHVRGRLEALLTRALTLDLVERAVPDQQGNPVVWSNGTRFRLKT
ncbi:MAG TPA: DUF1285 domain-containing protein [Hyphomicrobiaceae bacterium]|nr:DUF1285 domain-containing protein [Hyphomicrobiaceae bacterium]